MELKERAGRIAAELPALWLAMKDPRTPAAARIFSSAAVLYALSPVDLVPDFIPVLGQLDDLVLVPVLAGAALRRIPPVVLEECRARAQGLWAGGKPKKWHFALPVLLAWALLVVLIWALVRR